MRIKTQKGIYLEIIDDQILIPTSNTWIPLNQIMLADTDNEFANELRDVIREARMLIKSEGLF
jgi:hypothetical protein